MAVDYKQKYLNLRSKMMENVDVSYRLGYEQGMAEGQKQAQQEAQAMQQQMMMQQQGQPQVDENGQPIAPEEQQAMMEEGQMPEEGQVPEDIQDQGGGSDLDAHIQELESLVQKGEKPSVLSMRKAVDKIAGLRKAQKEAYKRNQSQIESSQKKIVNNVLKKWEDEANREKENNLLNKLIKESGVEIED